jgi:hypothetical protein
MKPRAASAPLLISNCFSDLLDVWTSEQQRTPRSPYGLSDSESRWLGMRHLGFPTPIFWMGGAQQVRKLIFSLR